MKAKPLPSQEYLQECFTYDPETGLLYWKYRPREHFKTSRGWNVFNSLFPKKLALNSINSGGYLVGKIDGKFYQSHRVIYKMIHGVDPEVTLHSAGDTSDNRVEKLNSNTQSKNMTDKKKYKTNSSGITGVCWYTRDSKWRVQITIDSKPTHFGYFNDFFEACCVRKSMEIKLGYHINHGRR